MKVAILAPIDTSLFSLLVAHEAHQASGLEVSGVVVRTPWTLARIRSEIVRDGDRLVRKVYEKMILRERNHGNQHAEENLAVLAQKSDLCENNLRQWSRRAGVPYRVVKDHNSDESLQFLAQMKPDLIAFTGGGLIRRNLLVLPTVGILNAHMGILPYYRGMDVVEWPVLEYKIDSIGIGVTLHFMNSGVDTGDILLQQKLIVTSHDTFNSIRKRLQVIMVELMLAAMIGLSKGTILRQTQKKEEGRQYFIMHPRLIEKAADRLKLYQNSLHQ